MQRTHIGLKQPLFALVLLGEQFLDDLGIDFHQHRQRTQHHDVLEERALTRVFIGCVANRRDRHADDMDVLAKRARRQWPCAVVEQVTTRLDLGQILRPGLRIHRDHHVDATAATQPTALGHSHLVPGGQALDVGRKDVARADRHTHAQNRFGEQLIG